MGTSAVFDLVGALVTTLDAALADVNVFDGFPPSDDPTDYVMVGVGNPDNEGRETSVEAEQSWAGLGARARDEAGSVTCVAVGWSGDTALSPLRTRMKALTTTIENTLRADPNLGGTVPGLQWVGYGTRTQLEQYQASDGACLMCVFDIAFKARI